MKQITLVNFEGNPITTIDLPETSKEVMFRQFVNMTMAMSEIPNDDKHSLTPEQYIRILVNVLGEFFEKPREVFNELDISGMNPDQAIEMESDLVLMINYLIGVSSYEPKLRDKDSYRFDYQGETFEIPYYRASAYVKGLTNRPDIKVGEITEVLEMNRIKAELVAQDKTGSEWFTLVIHKVATLARKPGEELPEDPAELRTLLAERTHFFQDIDLETALDMAFFLRSTIAKSRKMQHSSFSGMLPNR